MSEERRKKQLEREGGPATDPKTKKMFTYGVVLVLLAAAFIGGRYYRNHKYDSFAKCLARKQAKMYGLYWCPHCIEQKEMFGDAFHNVPYVECAIKGSSELSTACKDRWSQAVSQLAVWSGAAEGRSLVARCIKR